MTDIDVHQPTSATPETWHRFSIARTGRLQKWVAPLLLLVLTPPLVIVFWMAAVHFDGSLWSLARDVERAIALWPRPSWTALGIIAVWVAAQCVLLILLPGRSHLGPVTPMGNQPRYKLNAVAAFLVTHALLVGASYGLRLFSPTIVYDHFGELLMTLSLLAFIGCAALFVKGTRWPSSSDAGRSGNVIWDFFWGVELHPTILGIDLKQLVNCRVAMMGWSAILLSFAAKQVELRGTLSAGMAVSVGLGVAYIFKFFLVERVYFASLDIMHDRFGYYIAWGILTWLPAVYTLAPFYLVTQADTLSLPAAIALALFGLAALLVNYLADEQRHRVRAAGGNTTIWGKKPSVIVARYLAADGQPRENLLLVSGFWGLARHFHYAAEIAVAVAWTVPVGASHLLPWIYPLFLSILLVHRADRDDLRCRGKYGAAWEAYCQRVPWRILPWVH